MILFWLLLSSTYLFHSSAQQCPDQPNAHNGLPGPQQFEVYSKTKRCVYLRWMLPIDVANPVERYDIEITNNRTAVTQCKTSPDDFRIRNCEKWRNVGSICTGLCNLSTNDTYIFKVRAKYCIRNRVGSFSEQISTFMHEEEPEPPRNLTFLWKDSNLTLMWKHPFFPKGILRAFEIVINNAKPIYYKISKPLQTYNRSINTTGDTLNVSIQSINAAGYSKPALMTVARHRGCYFKSGEPNVVITKVNTAMWRGDSYLYIYNPTDSSLDCSNIRTDDAIITVKLSPLHVNKGIHLEGVHLSQTPIALILNEFKNYTACYSVLIGCS